LAAPYVLKHQWKGSYLNLAAHLTPLCGTPVGDNCFRALTSFMEDPLEKFKFSKVVRGETLKNLHYHSFSRQKVTYWNETKLWPKVGTWLEWQKPWFSFSCPTIQKKNRQRSKLQITYDWFWWSQQFFIFIFNQNLNCYIKIIKALVKNCIQYNSVKTL
jgi:hypothetical protein